MLKTAKVLMLAGAATTMLAVSALPANAVSAGNATASAYTNVRLEKVWGPTGICLSMNGKTTANAPVVQKKCTSGTDQRWTLSGTSAGIYTIKNKKSAKCLGISGTANGTVVTQRTCVPSSKTQQWYLADSKIHSKWAKKCLTEAGSTLGQKATITPCGQTTAKRKAQEWGIS
ncbi:RICIN domain-containing protein [Streptomyces sp. NPDC091279]|uniref:RICIN domain-containing protein n=1 Tax=unclassified Streptomyces TaxID=2593676 RepID=UPI0038017E79